MPSRKNKRPSRRADAKIYGKKGKSVWIDSNKANHYHQIESVTTNWSLLRQIWPWASEEWGRPSYSARPRYLNIFSYLLNILRVKTVAILSSLSQHIKSSNSYPIRHNRGNWSWSWWRSCGSSTYSDHTGELMAAIDNCKVNRCLARYSPHATTINRPTTGHRISLHGLAQIDQKCLFWAKFGRFWAKNPFLLEKSKVLLPT